MIMRTMPMQWGDKQQQDECAVCGKRLRPGRMWAVHVISGGFEVLHPDDEHLYKSDAGEMGSHMVGSECRKRFGDFAIRWNE